MARLTGDTPSEITALSVLLPSDAGCHNLKRHRRHDITPRPLIPAGPRTDPGPNPNRRGSVAGRRRGRDRHSLADLDRPAKDNKVPRLDGDGTATAVENGVGADRDAIDPYQ